MQDVDIVEKSKAIFDTISTDLKNLKNLEPEEIDFSEYFDDLKTVIPVFIDNKRIVGKFPSLKFLILVFTLEVAKKTRYSFWNTFFEEIDRQQEQTVRNFIFESSWECLLKLDCKVFEDYNGRHLVSTLLEKTNADPEFLTEILNFFIHYYQNFKGESISEVLERFSFNKKYLQNKDHREFIIQSTKKLTDAFDDIIEKYPDSFEDNEYLKTVIKKEYGINRTWFARTKVSTIIKSLMNTITPAQFLRVLKNHRELSVIHPEKGKIPIRLLESQIIDYGKYKINANFFTVTPNFRISINDMKNWPSEEIHEFRGITYYKKDKLFNVSHPPVRKLCDGNIKFYVWCGALPIGKEVILDTKKKRREGLWWNPRLKAQLIDFKNPTLSIECGNIIGYFQDYANKEFILSCGPHSKRKRIDYKGVITDENPRFLMSGNETKIQVSCIVDGNEKKQSIIEFDDHMLFSSSSREQIKNLLDFSKIVKRQFGEHSYFLFSIVKINEIQSEEQKNIRIKCLNATFGKYNIYEVIWETAGHFILKIQDYLWIFENQKYIQILFNNQGVFESISEMQVYLESNLQDVDGELHYKILNCTCEQITNPIEIELTSLHKNRLTLPGSSVRELLEGDLFPGEYIFEVQCGELIEKRPFFIVPHTEIKWPDLLIEGERSSVEIISEGPYLHDLKTNSGTNKLSIEIIGRVIEWGKDEKKIRPEEVLIKFSYIDPPRVAEKSPETPIFVFGYRLYRQFTEDSKIYLSNIRELNYYDLAESQLLIFSQPGDSFEILINDVKVLSGIFGSEGRFDQKNLDAFKQYCNRSINEVKISTHKISKKFQIIWYPRIISLDAPLEINSEKISGCIEFEGPEKSLIAIELKTPIALLDTKKIPCHNIKERKELEFDVKKSIDSYFFYLTTAGSIDGESFISSLSKIIYNTRVFYVKITVLDHKKTEVKLPIKNMQEGLKTYLDKITTYPKPILFQVYAKSRNSSIITQLLQLLTDKNQNYYIFHGVGNELEFVDSEQKINKTTSLSVLFDQQGNIRSQSSEKIFNPFTHDDVIKKGLGISSKKFYDDLEFYLPKPSLIILCNARKFRSLLEKKLIPKYRDRTFIFLESDI
jgi:hypothetical protein